jgi:hypothetical protein
MVEYECAKCGMINLFSTEKVVGEKWYCAHCDTENVLVSANAPQVLLSDHPAWDPKVARAIGSLSGLAIGESVGKVAKSHPAFGLGLFLGIAYSASRQLVYTIKAWLDKRSS